MATTIPPYLSAAAHDLFYDMHERIITAVQSGATPAEVLGAEVYNIARTVVAYADDDANQQMALTFVLETLPGLVYQMQQVEHWRRAGRGCREQ